MKHKQQLFQMFIFPNGDFIGFFFVVIIGKNGPKYIINGYE